LFPIIL
jgi:hypothetical protein